LDISKILISTILMRQACSGCLVHPRVGQILTTADLSLVLDFTTQSPSLKGPRSLAVRVPSSCHLDSRSSLTTKNQSHLKLFQTVLKRLENGMDTSVRMTNSVSYWLTVKTQTE
jgi:hypothetical protein